MSVFTTLCKKSEKIFGLLKLTCYFCDAIREIEQLTPLIEHFKIILIVAYETFLHYDVGNNGCYNIICTINSKDSVAP